MTKLEELKTLLKELKDYSTACTLLSWDLHTETPKYGIDTVVSSLTALSTKSFELSVSERAEKIIYALNEPDEYDQLDDVYKKTVRKLKKDFDESKRIPVDFYSSFVENRAKAESVWREAKITNNFALFAPYLEKNINNTIQLYKYMRPEAEPYAAMLDDYEKGMDEASIDRIFNELKTDLIPLVKAILSKPEPDASKFKGDFDINKQKELSHFLLEYIGFDFERGCIAESEHPFTSGTCRNDVRITNHYHKDDLLSAIFSIIHEGGHGLFMQGTDEIYDNTPFSDCGYMGLHESQSRIWENILGRNINFWKPIYHKLQEMFPEYKNISLEEFYIEINHIKNGFVRTESDEVTYCFHIILRYELEKELMSGRLSVNDLPAAWNAKMKEYLGIEPETDTLGVLQDTHWSGGMFGYFPSYLLGSIYDGMLLDKMNEELGDIDTILAEGRAKEITAWLKEKVHRYGGFREPKEVLMAVCGKEVTAEPLIRYFKEKYTKLYNL